MTKPTIDIIIPSYNGKHLLKKHLPEVIKYSEGVNKIIIVDDGSVDGTPEYLQENYPDIVCLHQKKNQGFTVSVNIGVRSSQADFICLLNNDVSPQKKYLQYSQKYFDDESVFAVSFNEINSSWPLVSWTGKFSFTRGEDKTKPYFSAWASGGSAIFRKDIWNKIGGMDEIYAPAYWEDIDIGYRAWKKGFKIVWDNSSIVNHQHESSYSKFDPGFINTIKQRNELLFNWINITDSDLVKSHLKWLIGHTISHPGYLRIVLLAMFRFIAQGKKVKTKVTDQQVFSSINRTVS